MSLFTRQRTPSAPILAAFMSGGLVTLAAIGYLVQRWIRAQPRPGRDDDEITDFSDPYLPSQARRGARRTIYPMA